MYLPFAAGPPALLASDGLVLSVALEPVCAGRERAQAIRERN
jgi:hypothetical protein